MLLDVTLLLHLLREIPIQTCAASDWQCIPSVSYRSFGQFSHARLATPMSSPLVGNEQRSVPLAEVDEALERSQRHALERIVAPMSLD